MSAGRVPQEPADHSSGRDLTGWFLRRAGLARFTTFACALGLSLSTLIGAQATVALTGLMLALAGAIGCLATRRTRPSCALVLSVLLVGLFAGYLGGTVRVASLLGGDLLSRIGSVVQAELVITGQVRCNAGWQSATAVIRSLGYSTGTSEASSCEIENAVVPDGPDHSGRGEKVLLEVPPDRRTGNGGAQQGIAKSVLHQGLIVSLRAVVRAPAGPSASGFNQARQLLHQGIEVVLRAEDPGSLVALGCRGGLAGWFDRLRASAHDHLARGPDRRMNEVLQGVVLGDTTGIDESWLEAFRRSGTAHMLAVSGLHVGSIAALMIGLARLTRAARWVGFLLAAVAAVLMIPFVGPSPPIIRAAAMVVVAVTGYWVGRSRDQWQILGLAAVVVLGLNPFAVFDVGFQLSFSALAGILALIRPIQRLLNRLPAAIGSNMAVSIAATIGTAPVSLAVFGRTSLVAPLANLLVVPFLPFIMGLGMAVVFLGFIWTGLSTALGTLASLPLSWTVLVCRLGAVAPVLGVADLGRALCALGAGLLVLPATLALWGRTIRAPFHLPLPLFRRFLVWLRSHGPRDRRLAMALGGAVLLCALFVGSAFYPVLAGGFERLETYLRGTGWPDKVEVRVLDIGQGNAVLVRTPERHALLFDGGPAGCDLAGELRSLGVRRLELVVISHPHADHFAGLLESLDSLEIGVLVDQVQLISGAQAGTQVGPPGGVEEKGNAADRAQSSRDEASEYLDLRRQLAEEECRYVCAAAGDSIKVGGVVVRFFAPARPLVLVDGPDPWAERGSPPSGDELNSASLVAVLSMESVDVLIPGDAEADVLKRYNLPPTEILVVPHHGSRGGVSGSLLETLRAEVAVVSSGKGNPFGHPDAETMSVLETAVGVVLRTDTVGWVSCMVEGDEMVITSERTPER